MSAIVRILVSRRALAFPLLSTLVLLLTLSCGPAASPVTPEPQASASTPVANGIVQTPTQAATPAPSATPTTPPTAIATPERTGDVQATVNDSKNAGESNPQSEGTGDDGQAASNLQGDEASGYGGASSILQDDGTSEDNQAPPIPDKGELRYPNLGSRLDELVASVESGETTAEEAASGAAMHSGESVAVTIYLSGGVEEVVAFLEENGGDPRNVGEDYIEAYVPVTLLGSASELHGVVRVREIVPPERAQGG